MVSSQKFAVGLKWKRNQFHTHTHTWPLLSMSAAARAGSLFSAEKHDQSGMQLSHVRLSEGGGISSMSESPHLGPVWFWFQSTLGAIKEKRAFPDFEVGHYGNGISVESAPDGLSFHSLLRGIPLFFL